MSITECPVCGKQSEILLKRFTINGEIYTAYQCKECKHILHSYKDIAQKKLQKALELMKNEDTDSSHQQQDF